MQTVFFQSIEFMNKIIKIFVDFFIMVALLLQHERVIPEDRLDNVPVFGLDTFLQDHTLFQVRIKHYLNVKKD